MQVALRNDGKCNKLMIIIIISKIAYSRLCIIRYHVTRNIANLRQILWEGFMSIAHNA